MNRVFIFNLIEQWTAAGQHKSCSDNTALFGDPSFLNLERTTTFMSFVMDRGNGKGSIMPV